MPCCPANSATFPSAQSELGRQLKDLSQSQTNHQPHPVHTVQKHFVTEISQHYHRYADALNLKLNPELAAAKAKEEAERKKKEEEEQAAAKAPSEEEESMEVAEESKDDDDDDSADKETAEVGDDPVRRSGIFYFLTELDGFNFNLMRN